MMKCTRQETNAMVCAECFRAKGESELKAPCQNPKCYFYLRTQPPNTRTLDTEVNALSFSLANGLTFSKEMRSKARAASYSAADMFMPAATLTSSEQHQVRQRSNSLWGFPPEPATSMSRSDLNLQLDRTSLYGSRVATNSTLQKVRSQSISDASRLYPPSGETARSRLLRSRMMSVPGCVEPLRLRLSDHDNDIVEDAFLNSPLPELGEELRFGTPETDSGISSPFGRPSSMLEWVEPKQTQLPPHTSSTTGSMTFETVLSKPSTLVSAALDIPSSSSSTGGRSYSPNATTSNTSLAKRFLPAPNSFPMDTYSRKVFIGGLPPDIDEDDIRLFFLRFGSLMVDWPHKTHSKGCIPPKGYAFLLFKEESSVHKLLFSCTQEGDKRFIFIPTSAISRKKIQVRPWYIADSQCVLNSSKPLDQRKAVFVGGVPRPLKASELAEVMNEKYGTVVFVAIDSDSDLKYPKGAACVVFSDANSYIAAVSSRFMQLSYGSLEKKIEIKPYVLDGQLCDECHGLQCNGKPAPFFCGSVTCLQYYCEYCWATVHSMPGKQNHRPLLKDVGERARFYDH